ncbi:hypothetical protein ACPA9J_07920 [Pseudomonas aeruginosa]
MRKRRRARRWWWMVTSIPVGVVGGRDGGRWLARCVRACRKSDPAPRSAGLPGAEQGRPVARLRRFDGLSAESDQVLGTSFGKEQNGTDVTVLRQAFGPSATPEGSR